MEFSRSHGKKNREKQFVRETKWEKLFDRYYQIKTSLGDCTFDFFIKNVYRCI